MKKILLVFLALGALAYGQSYNVSVNVEDEIYSLLDYAEIRGLIAPLGSARPYTQEVIKKAIDEILLSEDKLNKVEIDILNSYLENNKMDTKRPNGISHLALTNNNPDLPISFNYGVTLDSNGSGGLYTNDFYNSAGFDIMPTFTWGGDFTKYCAYNFKVLADASYMPLTQMGNDYVIGYEWYDTNVKTYFGNEDDKSGSGAWEEAKKKVRTINTYRNTSYLPYSYKKRWSGQFYQLSNLSASGTEGWATKLGFSFTMEGELRLNLLDDRFTLGLSRVSREWGAMDQGSSLVYNQKAQPFFALDSTTKLLPWLKFSFLTGILEYPNQDYINENAFTDTMKANHGSNVDDSYFFQNAFSLNMIELDYKYVHLDMGSSVVYPKRWEAGYLFPMAVFVEYQNHIGDSDNLALFGDLKLRKPGLGSIWASLYLDEINGFNNNPTTSTRAMFAGQLGCKVAIPSLPFGTISARYTKVEPYCYTHHAINYASWYDHYVCENYTNNGDPLGYYLEPNSDEFLLKFDMRPTSRFSTSIQYQMIRHGADFGSQSVPGSSYYSELSIYNRDELKKYFLHDGAYNWMHIVSFSFSEDFKHKGKPLSIYSTIGFMYSYYTVIDNDKYDRSIYGNYGNCKDADNSTPFHYVDNSEYPSQMGAVLSLGIKTRL